MSRRIDKTWVVVESIENDQHDRCVDFFQRPDGTWGFEEFRRDVEDRGGWTPVAYYADGIYASKGDARSTAARVILWLA
jgi:hypothetical protein